MTNPETVKNFSTTMGEQTLARVERWREQQDFRISRSAAIEYLAKLGLDAEDVPEIKGAK